MLQVGVAPDALQFFTLDTKFLTAIKIIHEKNFLSVYKNYYNKPAGAFGISFSYFQILYGIEFNGKKNRERYVGIYNKKIMIRKQVYVNLTYCLLLIENF